METIGERKTIREFKAQNVDDQTLSEILWVAFGISHDGKRTIPTAMNQQNLKVYVVRHDGAWLYDAAENSLTQVTAENLQPLFATQDFMKDVPVNLVYVGSDEKYSPLICLSGSAGRKCQRRLFPKTIAGLKHRS